MTIKSTLLQVRKQFTNNWFRMLLASGGILIGVWAIAITTSLSLSLADTIITAINSQPGATQISLSRSSEGKTDFQELEFDSEFSPISIAEVEDIVAGSDTIIESYPTVDVATYITGPENQESCYTQNQNVITQLNTGTIKPEEAQKIQEDFRLKCPTATIDFQPLSLAVKADQNKWVGQKFDLSAGEVAVCFECNPNTPLYKIFAANNPSDLLGQTITIDFTKPPTVYKLGEGISNTFIEEEQEIFPEPNQIELTIRAVFDDRDQETNVFQGQGNNTFYGTTNLIQTAISPVSDLNLETAGFQTFSLKTDSFDNTAKTIEDLQDKGYLAGSGALSLIQAIQYFFYGVSAVLGLFGFIALIASMFGIINVMTISVLKRKKEIGILKALGARGKDIFNIFILESSLLGFIGWAAGILTTYICLLLSSWAFDQFVLSNEDWKQNLQNLNIGSFEPVLYWWVAAITLALALIITIISGLAPSLRAAKQNPVDVLR